MLLLTEQNVMVRAVNLNNKPDEMLTVSPKGTVPILVIEVVREESSDDLMILDESLDIMLWALHQNDPQDLLYAEQPNALPEILELIQKNDVNFVSVLEKYKHASRYYDFTQLYYRRQCEVFIAELEQTLQTQDYFFGPSASLADYALLPFIRQFARVDRQWYLQSPYPKLRDWLNRQLQQPLFTKAMTKYPLWTDGQQTFVLGSSVQGRKH